MDKRIIKKQMSPEFIKSVEGSKLEIDDKVNLLLTATGLKPASELLFIIREGNEKSIWQRISEDDVKKIIFAVEKSGIPFRLGERKIDTHEYEEINTAGENTGVKKVRKIEHMQILVGRSKKDLNRLEEALKLGRDLNIYSGPDLVAETKEELEQLEKKLRIKSPKSKSKKLYDRQIGLAFGYPPTAVEAFVGKRKQLDITTLPEKIRFSDAMLFSSPTLSANNWQKEIKQGQVYADFIKSVSPAIYEKMIEIIKKSYGELSIVFKKLKKK